MDYAEIKNLMKDMENSSLDSIEIELPEGTKVKMRKSPIVYAGLNYDAVENSSMQNISKEKNVVENTDNNLNNKEEITEKSNSKNEENYKSGRQSKKRRCTLHYRSHEINERNRK